MKILNKSLSLLLIFAFVFLVSCRDEGLIVSGDGYIEFYESIANKLGFSVEGQIFEENDMRGFSAFDGIFTVCFTIDGEGFINYLSISTSPEFGKTVQTEQELHEALLWASYLAMPFYKTGAEYTDTDISTAAGMLLASFDEKVNFETMVCTSEKNETGFEISFLAY